MNYQNIIDEYKINNDLRVLLMKLPITCNIKDLYSYMCKKNIFIKTDNVKELFKDIKGYIDVVDDENSKKNRCKIVHIHTNSFSRNKAVELIFRILNNELIDKDKCYIYNIIFYILTHSRVFTNRIRYHLINIIFNNYEYNYLLTKKQKDRIKYDMEGYEKLYKFSNDNDYDEYDSEPEPIYNEESEDENPCPWGYPRCRFDAD